MSLLKNRYFLSGIGIYTASFLYLHFVFQQSLTDMLIPFFIVGTGFSFVAWWMTRTLSQPQHQSTFKKEIWLLIILVGWITFYITYGGSLVNKIIPASWVKDPEVYSIIIFLRKLAFFVLVPFAVYKFRGFSLDDFGLTKCPVKLFSKRSITIFLLLAIAATCFQYFFSNGAKPVRNGEFNASQLIIGLPICFIYLLFDAGLIEEFFFRGFLQSRLSALLKSTTGSIIVSSIIFGLVHSPGLYLRGAGSEGIEEQLPFSFFSAYTLVYMSTAGLFLGIIYNKTKNLWLVMAIHAAVDLLPNLDDFIQTWNIK